MLPIDFKHTCMAWTEVDDKVTRNAKNTDGYFCLRYFFSSWLMLHMQMWHSVGAITLSTWQVWEYEAWGGEYSNYNKMMQNQWRGLIWFMNKQDIKVASQWHKLCWKETGFYVNGSWMPKLSLILAIIHRMGSIFTMSQNSKLIKHFEVICAYRLVGRQALDFKFRWDSILVSWPEGPWIQVNKKESVNQTSHP